MKRPLSKRLRSKAFPLALIVLTISWYPSYHTPAQEGGTETTPGQFFTIDEPISFDRVEELKASTQPLVDRFNKPGQGDRGRPTLVFHIKSGDNRPGQTSYGVAYELSELIARKLSGAKMTVAYVSEPLSGYAVLVALACDEIVMGPDATLGPILPEGERPRNAVKEYVRDLARLKGREPELFLGMLEPNADLRLVRVDDRSIHHVFSDNLAEFKKTHIVVSDEPAWQGARAGVLTAEESRRQGLAKMIAENRSQIANAYHLASKAAVDDPTIGDDVKPLWIRIDGRVDSTKEAYLRRRIIQASQEGLNLLIFQINSEGGEESAADNVADLIDGVKNMKTVAYIDDRALGMSCLIPLACDEIVFRLDSKLGNLQHTIPSSGNPRLLDQDQIKLFADKAARLARNNHHPEAVARMMVDPVAELVQAKDNQTGAVMFILASEMDLQPGRYTVLDRIRDRQGERLLTLDDKDALAYGMTQNIVKDDGEFKAIFNLKNKSIRVDTPTWVDTIVTTLNTTWMRTLLLFIGMLMLILEIKVPGVGLPAIISALSFLLFFWSSYMNKTADELEIILFVVGLVCLGLELFVFPGVGVFGMSGVLLILVSVVMASHTFVWPTQDSEYRQMGGTLLQITLVLLGVMAGAVIIGRYFPSIPLFNRMVLKPEPYTPDEVDADPTAKPAATGDAHYHYLIGETGRTTTVLRPSGKARIGDQLIDVTADGFFIERDTLVEVVDVQGSRVIVKRV
jgi:membrane-bound serine protease (ClpP class)